MKKIYLLSICSLFFANLNSQITLTSATSTPQVGNSFNYFVTQNNIFNARLSGANQTWDFSSATGTNQTVNNVTLSNSTFPTTYTTANLVEKGPGFEAYYQNTSTEISLVGQYIENYTKVIFTDGKELVKFPISYTNSFTETFSGTVENLQSSQTFDRSGTIEITANAYGKIILPYGTVDDVLRVRSVYNYSDTYSGTPVFTYTDTNYYWYNATTKSYVAAAYMIYMNGSLSGTQSNYISQTNLTTASTDELTASQISMYPNPAKNLLTVENTSSEAISIEIYDLRGAKLKTETIQSGKSQLSVSDLNSGAYIVKYISKDIIYTEKLSIK